MDLSRARLKPYDHQAYGVEWLVDLLRPEEGRVLPGGLMLADEMGAGKTKQSIDAAQVLFDRDEIDRVLVIAPSPVRSVWFDSETGELQKHLWLDVEASVTEYHARIRKWHWSGRVYQPNDQRDFKPRSRRLDWIITNYEFVRSASRYQRLLKIVGPRVLLILDESAMIKSHRAKQTRACASLRQRCQRVWLLNGTPIAHSPNDLFSQSRTMHPGILNCRQYFTFRAQYAVMGGFQQRQIISWRDLEGLQAKLKPYVLRRLKEDCLDLPPKLDPVTITTPLSSETWKVYKELRDELVTWLDSQTVVTTAQAPIRVMRLAQITAGFVSGAQKEESCEECDGTGIGHATNDACLICDGAGRLFPSDVVPPREVGREKLDLILDWTAQRLEEDKNLKLLLWCRFRPELKRFMVELEKRFPHVTLGALWGSQNKDERTNSLRLLKPGFAPKGPVIVVGTLGTGSVGVDLAASHEVVYCSNDYSLFKRKQSMDRVHRPGQTFPVSYLDVVATGPKGQKTVDHVIVKALQERDDLATWTTQAWVSALDQE